MWHGYLEQDELLMKLLRGYRLEELHTSGHADIETIEEVIHTVKPKMVVPIHTNNPDSFPSNLSMQNIKDGEEIIF